MFLTKLEIDLEQRHYLDSLETTQEEINAIEKDEDTSFIEINKLIKILLTVAKVEEAYTHIRNNLDNIDFKDIMSCPYMRLDRTANDIYAHMFKTGVIDKQNFMYFEAICGKLSEWEEFWKPEFDGLTTTQILDVLYNSFNNLFVSQNINPYELGLINLTPEQEDEIFGRLTDGELIDQIFAERPCVYVGPTRMVSLLMNGNLNKDLAHVYLKIIYHMNFEMYKEVLSEVEFKEIITNFWDFVSEYASANDLNITELVKSMELDSMDKINCLIDYKNEHEFEADLLSILINNAFTINYPYTIMERLGINESIKVSKYIDPKNFGFVVSYKLCDRLFDTSDFIIKYPFPSGYPVVYNTSTGDILMGDKVSTLTNDNVNKLFGFIDDYIECNVINDDLFKNFSSIDEYVEFIKAMNEFRNAII